MGPRSENRGYEGAAYPLVGLNEASMGPRSENRGYVRGWVSCRPWDPRFNGSTVREPWLCSPEWNQCYCSDLASMGPRSENRGYASPLETVKLLRVTSFLSRGS